MLVVEQFVLFPPPPPPPARLHPLGKYSAHVSSSLCPRSARRPGPRPRRLLPAHSPLPRVTPRRSTPCPTGVCPASPHPHPAPRGPVPRLAQGTPLASLRAALTAPTSGWAPRGLGLGSGPRVGGAAGGRGACSPLPPTHSQLRLHTHAASHGARAGWRSAGGWRAPLPLVPQPVPPAAAGTLQPKRRSAWARTAPSCPRCVEGTASRRPRVQLLPAGGGGPRRFFWPGLWATPTSGHLSREGR